MSDGTRKGRPHWAVTAGALLIVGLWIYSGLSSSPSDATPRPRSTTQASLAAEIRQACMMSVQDRLVSPATMRVAGRTEPELQADGRWFHVLEVDSQNSFGALIRSRWGCAYKNGGVDEVIQTR